MTLLCTDKRGKELKCHEVPRNDGVTSKGMEEILLLTSTRKNHNRGMIVTYVVADNDYFMGGKPSPLQGTQKYISDTF